MVGFCLLPKTTGLAQDCFRRLEIRELTSAQRLYETPVVGSFNYGYSV
jgi:hypothetical protein